MSASDGQALLTDLRDAKLKSVPLAAIITPDQMATIEMIQKNLTWKFGKAVVRPEDLPMLRWDPLNGLTHVNERGKLALVFSTQTKPKFDAYVKIVSKPQEDWSQTEENEVKATWKEANNTLASLVGQSASKCLQFAHRLPEDTILFMLNMHRFLDAKVEGSIGVIQGVMNLRNPFKKRIRVWELSDDKLSTETRMLVMLLPEDRPLPVEIAQDVLILEEDFPSEEVRRRVILDNYNGAGLGPPEESVMRQALDATRAINLFSVEQEVALSIEPKKGLSIPHLWRRAMRLINSRQGLSIFDEVVDFNADIGGQDNLKRYLKNVTRGLNPGSVVFWDEIDKDLSGAANDSGDGQESGATGLLGEILKWWEDFRVIGILINGPGGTGKSLIAKALGTYLDVKTFKLEVKAAESKWRGESTANLRGNLRAITSFSDRRPFVIATANRPEIIASEMKGRFAAAFYARFPLAAERAAIWPIQLKAFGLPTQATPNDQGWVGRDIRNCCENAHLMLDDRGGNIPVTDAAQYISPAHKRDAARVQTLDRLAMSEGWISTVFNAPFNLQQYLDAEEGTQAVMDLGDGRKILEVD